MATPSNNKERKNKRYAYIYFVIISPPFFFLSVYLLSRHDFQRIPQVTRPCLRFRGIFDKSVKTKEAEVSSSVLKMVPRSWIVSNLELSFPYL